VIYTVQTSHVWRDPRSRIRLGRCLWSKETKKETLEATFRQNGKRQLVGGMLGLVS
jgi:hypothetical protein